MKTDMDLKKKWMDEQATFEFRRRDVRRGGIRTGRSRGLTEIIATPWAEANSLGGGDLQVPVMNERRRKTLPPNSS